jgi:tetratricopeptide (TPR) repeat protein
MPELSPGTYILKITAVDTESPQEAERLITVLGEQSDTVITATQDAERARSNLQARGISADVQTLAAAHIYIAADMYNDALNLLEPLTQSQDTDVRLSASMLIARMYAQNDLAYEAIEAYHAALEIVQEQYPTHIRRLAAIRLGYGRVWLSFGHEYLVQARPHLSEARDLYMRLNATDRVCWIADKLDDADEE